MLEADNQERETPIELGSGEKEKIQISNKRFTQSLYSDRTGGYAGKQRLFFPIFCLIVGLPLLGFGIFAITGVLHSIASNGNVPNPATSSTQIAKQDFDNSSANCAFDNPLNSLNVNHL